MVGFQDTTIDGVSYKVTQLPAMRAMKLLNRITRVASAALGKVAASFKGSTVGANLADLDAGAALSAVEAMFSKLSDEELEHLTRELLSTAQVIRPGPQGEMLVPVMMQFDTLFMGNLPAALKLMMFAFQVNYGNFLDALQGLKALAPAPARA